MLDMPSFAHCEALSRYMCIYVCVYLRIKNSMFTCHQNSVHYKKKMMQNKKKKTEQPF